MTYTGVGREIYWSGKGDILEWEGDILEWEGDMLEGEGDMLEGEEIYWKGRRYAGGAPITRHYATRLPAPRATSSQRLNGSVTYASRYDWGVLCSSI